MSKFDKIAAFLAVIEEGSFAAAAKKSHQTTASISKQISSLESLLGTQLLHRTTRKVSPTETGLSYYRDCKIAVSGLQEAEFQLKSEQEEATGTLRAVVIPYFAKKYIIPHLSGFLKKNPRLQVHLEIVERFPNLLDEKIDLLFGASRSGLEDWVSRKIYETRYVLCASPEYLKKNGSPKKPEELVKFHYITHLMRDPNDIVPFKKDKKIKVSPSLYFNDAQSMSIAAQENLGIINVHDYIVKDQLANGTLIEILSEFQEAKVPINFYYQKTKYLQPKIRKFIDYFIPFIVPLKQI